jgi:hypothetical protein
MKIPASFLKFQSLIAESGPLAEVGAGAGGETKTKEASLSFLCDSILSSLHSREEFRDAVVDSRANVPGSSILLILNSELSKEAIQEMVGFIAELDGVTGIGFGKRKDPQTGDEIMALKITGQGEESSPQGDTGKPANATGGTAPSGAVPAQPVKSSPTPAGVPPQTSGV